MRKDFLGSTEGIKLEKYIRYYEDSYGNELSEDISTYTIMKINRGMFDDRINYSSLKYAKLNLKIMSMYPNHSYDIDVNEITKFSVNNTTTSYYPYENIDGCTDYEKRKIGTLKRNNNVYEGDLSSLFKENYYDEIILELSFQNAINNEDYINFYSPNYSDTTKTPSLTLVFLDNTGLADYLTYHNVSTGNNTAYINDCFGNLVIEQKDYISSSKKQSFNISHYYNSNLSLYDFGYGNGIRVSYLERLIKDEELDNDYYYIFDSTGRKKYYIKGETTQLGTKYISEEGEDEYLLINDTVSKKIVEENIGQITALIKALEKMKNNIIKESQETQEKLDQLIVQVEV